MKLLILPSESQVMSCIVAVRSGRSSSRLMGMMGNSWSIDHESGSDWKSEKLQKYLSGNSFEILRNSSGACFMSEAISFTSRATDQKSCSI